MSEIQKALEAESRQQGSGSGEADPLTVPDHSFCGILTDYDDDESLFGEMLQPGLFHSISGDRKSGKTHLCVNLMYLLAIGFQGCGDWEIITNIFMYRKEGTGIKVSTPEHVHHVDSIDELFMKIIELYGRGRNVALVLDDIDNFYSESGKGIVTEQIRKLIVNRDKLGILLITTCRNGFLEFESDRRNSDYRCDSDWSRYDNEKIWENSRKDHNFDPKWKRLDANELCLPDGDWINVFLSVTDWTEGDKESGWFFDRGTCSSILRYDKAFDFNTFWKGFGNISSLEVTDYVQRYCKSHPATPKSEKIQMVEKYAEIAAVLKSMGLTDEAIEYALKIPKTTLRRWTEKQGYEWRKWSMDHPFRFKKVCGEKQGSGQSE